MRPISVNLEERDFERLLCIANDLKIPHCVLTRALLCSSLDRLEQIRVRTLNGRDDDLVWYSLLFSPNMNGTRSGDDNGVD